MNSGINYFANTYNTDSNRNWFLNFDKFIIDRTSGSITCRADKDFIVREESLVSALLDESMLNMEVFCDDQCLNNFEMASVLYDSYFDVVYIIPYSVSDDFSKGKEVTIYCREPRKEERKQIREFY